MLKNFLARNRKEITNEWIESVVATYPEGSANFLLRKKDRFHNPIGHAITNELPRIIDQILGDMDFDTIGPALDKMIRIRSVQEFTPSYAVKFVFDLKTIFRGWMQKGDIPWSSDAEQLFDRIDKIELLAFDIYTGCRDQMHEIRIREIKNRSARFFDQLGKPPEEGKDE